MLLSLDDDIVIDFFGLVLGVCDGEKVAFTN
jgi:hypothetical protein